MRAVGGLLYGERMSAETITARFDVTGWDRAELPGLGLSGADGDWLGAVVIFVSNMYISHREVVRRGKPDLTGAVPPAPQ